MRMTATDKGDGEGCTHGVRCSGLDATVLAACGVGTWLVYPHVGQFALVPAIVLGHFFLFCNVFLIPRSYELIWGGAFVAVFGVTCGVLKTPVWAAVLVQTPVSVALVVAAMRRADYHGVLARRMNRGTASPRR